MGVEITFKVSPEGWLKICEAFKAGELRDLEISELRGPDGVVLKDDSVQEVEGARKPIDFVQTPSASKAEGEEKDKTGDMKRG